MDCPEHFPVERGVREGGAGSTSCAGGSDGRGSAMEREPEIWPGVRLPAQGVEWLLLPEVVEVELEWPDLTPQEERAGGAEAVEVSEKKAGVQ